MTDRERRWAAGIAPEGLEAFHAEGEALRAQLIQLREGILEQSAALSRQESLAAALARATRPGAPASTIDLRG